MSKKNKKWDDSNSNEVNFGGLNLEERIVEKYQTYYFNKYGERVVVFEELVDDRKKYQNFMNQIINNRSEKRKLEKPLSSEQEKDLNEFIDTLTDREKEIITLGFGLDGKEPLSFPVIGHKLNCSAGRVILLKSKIISKMPPQLNELFKQMDKSLHHQTL